VANSGILGPMKAALVGAELNHYKVIAQLGKGGMDSPRRVKRKPSS
jgi:hypothetical protein